MEPTLGFEPRTGGLQNRCSAPELRRLVCRKGMPSPVSRFLRGCLQSIRNRTRFSPPEPATAVYSGLEPVAKCAGKCAG